MITARVVGGDLVAAGFAAAAAATPSRVGEIVRRHGLLLETRIKAKASGRPGPNAPTGDYRRSWTTRFTQGPGQAVSVTGTNAPQGRRLEYGFVGVDSLGRHYNQPPYPHVGPAAQEIEPAFVAEIQTMLKAL